MRTMILADQSPIMYLESTPIFLEPTGMMKILEWEDIQRTMTSREKNLDMGLVTQGMIWEKLLTDTDGQYVEVQSGRLFNQAAEGSTFTPFKHKGFMPYATDVWTEYWFPVLKNKRICCCK